MNRNLLLFGTVAVFGLAAVAAGAGNAIRSSKSTCEKSAMAASVSSCCAKDGGAAAASVNASAPSCPHSAATAASANGCTRDASVQNAAMGACCDKATAAAAGTACEKGAAAAAAGDACCKTGAVKTAAGEACKETCDEAKTASAFKGAVDELPYAESKRVVLSGAYVCGHCNLKVTEGCSPMFKTADGKVYPLIKNPEASQLRAANEGNGVEIATTVKKIDGVKYLEVKSYKTL
jgi:hypothetical protein